MRAELWQRAPRGARLVVGRAAEGVRAAARAHALREAEVHHLQVAVRAQQQVLGLQVLRESPGIP